MSQVSDDDLSRLERILSHNPKSAEEYVAWKHALSQEANLILQVLKELRELRNQNQMEK